MQGFVSGIGDPEGWQQLPFTENHACAQQTLNPSLMLVSFRRLLQNGKEKQLMQSESEGLLPKPK